MQRFKVTVMCLLFLIVTSFAFAGEVDVLIKKLVEKGILTEQEAKAVLADTKASVTKQLEAGKLDTLPAWVQNTKWAGDFRLRWQNIKTVEPGSKRARSDSANIRFRYGFEAKVNDEINAGARLATGSSQSQGSRTNNLDNAFQTKSIWLDLGYLTYSPKPVKGLKLIGGKFANPFYTTSTLIWGAEINPEGVATQYTRTVRVPGTKQAVSLFANAGILPLDIDSNFRPVIYAMQAGGSTKVFDRTLKGAVAYYYFADIRDMTYGNVSPSVLLYTNSVTAAATTGRFLYDYRVLSLDAEYPILNIKYQKLTLPLGIYAGLVKNVAEEVKKDAAWLVGFSLGKAVDPKSWSFSYDYRRVARDATVDFLNDSTFHGGGTNAKGHKISLSYIPLKNTTLTLNYYDTEKAQGLKTTGEKLDTLQLECLVKF